VLADKRLADANPLGRGFDVKKKRFSVGRSVAVLKQMEAGSSVTERFMGRALGTK